MRTSPRFTLVPLQLARAARPAAAALSLGLLVAAGCTVQVSMPELPPQHPANPEAAVTPLPPPSPLLDSYLREVPPAEELPGRDAVQHEPAEGEEPSGDEATDPDDPHRHHTSGDDPAGGGR